MSVLAFPSSSHDNGNQLAIVSIFSEQPHLGNRSERIRQPRPANNIAACKQQPLRHQREDAQRNAKPTGTNRPKCCLHVEKYRIFEEDLVHTTGIVIML